MKEIIFRHNILQKDGRVKIPSPIVDSLNIKEGQPIDIILDTQKECIIIRKNDKD
ncbi:hypothetical protein J4419_00125 [Candidatus Woesearchaeota archaeon]|nr:hypothetical protein [Candidatus Woesearchaeota archaeon]